MVDRLLKGLGRPGTIDCRAVADQEVIRQVGAELSLRRVEPQGDVHSGTGRRGMEQRGGTDRLGDHQGPLVIPPERLLLPEAVVDHRYAGKGRVRDGVRETEQGHSEAIRNRAAVPAVAIEQLDDGDWFAQSPDLFHRLRFIDRIDKPYPPVGGQGVGGPLHRLVDDPGESDRRCLEGFESHMDESSLDPWLRWEIKMLFGRKPTEMPAPGEALPGRDGYLFEIPARHRVLDSSLEAPFPDGTEIAYFAMGCFWGAERLFWQIDGVQTTAVGYQNGSTPFPTYEEVCSGMTGHAEAVMVAFDPAVVSYAELVRVFLTEHDPTQGMRQGNDVGTQYRSAIFFTSAEQEATALGMVAAYGDSLAEQGLGPVTTEVVPAGPFYLAEPEHQQYLDRVPNGYCGLAGTGVACAIPGASR